MGVIKAILTYLLCVVVFLVGINYVASTLLGNPWLHRAVSVTPLERSRGLWPLRVDPVTGWALAPPADDATGVGEFQLSATGVGIRWLPGTLDMGPPLLLLVLGDEMAFGSSLPLNSTFCGWIKRDTEERLGDRTLAVADAAVPGYDAVQMSLQFEQLKHLKPHLTLCCFSAGQSRDHSRDGIDRPASIGSARVRGLFYGPSLCRALYFGIDRLTGRKDVPPLKWEITKANQRPPDADAFEGAVREMIRDADRARIPLLMTSIALPEVCRSRLEALCATEEVAYFDGDQALLDHAHENVAALRPDGLAGIDEMDHDAAVDRDTGGGELEWWIGQNLRDEVAPVFRSRTYFTPKLLPTRVAYRALGLALSNAISEGDLFSWRHRVLR